jgi:hypothetical protein
MARPVKSPQSDTQGLERVDVTRLTYTVTGQITSNVNFTSFVRRFRYPSHSATGCGLWAAAVGIRTGIGEGCAVCPSALGVSPSLPNIAKSRASDIRNQAPGRVAAGRYLAERKIGCSYERLRAFTALGSSSVIFFDPTIPPCRKLPTLYTRSICRLCGSLACETALPETGVHIA